MSGNNTDMLRARISQDESNVARLQENLSKRYRDAMVLRETIDQRAAEARTMEHCIVDREQRAAAHAARAVQEMSKLRRLPTEFLDSLDQTEARDCICAVHAEAQMLHEKFLRFNHQYDRAEDLDEGVLELDRMRAQRDRHVGSVQQRGQPAEKCVCRRSKWKPTSSGR